MVGHSNLVKEAMQLANNGVDLLRKVASVHLGGAAARAAQRRVAMISVLCLNPRSLDRRYAL